MIERVQPSVPAEDSTAGRRQHLEPAGDVGLIANVDVHDPKLPIETGEDTLYRRLLY